jgi:hypothetical protein
VNAVIEVAGLGIGALELVRRIGNVSVGKPLGLAGLTPSQEVPAAIELGLDRLEPGVALGVTTLPHRPAQQLLLLLDQGLDPVSRGGVVHRRHDNAATARREAGGRLIVAGAFTVISSSRPRNGAILSAIEEVGMTKQRKLIAIGAGVLALAVGGAGVAVATGGGDDSEAPIEGAALDRASAAALAHTGGGEVTETEVGDEESYYEVEVTLDDGRQVDVQLDRDFNVVGDEADDAGEDDTDDAGADD